MNAVALAVSLKVGDVLEAVGKELLQIPGGVLRKALVFGDDLWVHLTDQYFFIVAAIENANAPAWWEFVRRAPEKIVIQFFFAGAFEGVDLHALWIDAAHHVLDGAVLASSIHRLKDKQHPMAILGIHLLLKLIDLLLVLSDQAIVVFVILIDVFDLRLCLVDFERAAVRDAIGFQVEFKIHVGEAVAAAVLTGMKPERKVGEQITANSCGIQSAI